MNSPLPQVRDVAAALGSVRAPPGKQGAGQGEIKLSAAIRRKTSVK